MTVGSGRPRSNAALPPRSSVGARRSRDRRTGEAGTNKIGDGLAAAGRDRS